VANRSFKSYKERIENKEVTELSPINVPESDLKALDEGFQAKESESGEAIIVTHPEGLVGKYSKNGFDPTEVLSDAQEFLEE